MLGGGEDASGGGPIGGTLPLHLASGSSLEQAGGEGEKRRSRRKETTERHLKESRRMSRCAVWVKGSPVQSESREKRNEKKRFFSTKKRNVDSSFCRESSLSG